MTPRKQNVTATCPKNKLKLKFFFSPTGSWAKKLVENTYQPASKFSGVLWWQGGKRKESLQLRLWNLNMCINKSKTSLGNADWQR